MSHTLNVENWTVYHNGDFSGDVSFCIPASTQIVNIPIEVLRAVIAAEVRANAIRFYESATDEAVLNKVTEF